MAAFKVPPDGLSLVRAAEKPTDFPSDVIASGQSAQLMNLTLASNIIDELVDVLIKGDKATLCLGKRPAVKYGSKSHSFHFSKPDPVRCELYAMHPETTETSAFFAGVYTHQLGAQKLHTELDAATAALRQRREAEDREREARQTQMISDVSDLQALGTGDRRSVKARQVNSRSNFERQRILNKAIAEHRATPMSPAGLSTPMSTAGSAPSSTPLLFSAEKLSPAERKEKRRLDALKEPFIHLLAMRPLSIKYIAKTTRSSPEDIRQLVAKYAQDYKCDRDKVQLRDKSYKELRPWDFPYPSEDSRQEAINNAISAFDRLRLDKSDNLWQLLLPKEERGKGKILSKLNLSAGGRLPIPTPLPRAASEARSATGNDSEHTIGGVTPRSTAAKTTPQPKRTKLSQGTASKVEDKPIAKLDTKSRDDTPDPAAAKAKLPKKTTTAATAKSGAGTKKSVTSSKIKSEEFMHDSGEEGEVTPSEAQRTQKRRTDTEKTRNGTKAPAPSVPSTDHQKEREKEKEQEREKEREREREREREKEREKDREMERIRERDREREIQRKKATEQPPPRETKPSTSATTTKQEAPTSSAPAPARRPGAKNTKPFLITAASNRGITTQTYTGSGTSSLVSPPINASDVNRIQHDRRVSATPSGTSSPRKNAGSTRATGMKTPVSTEAAAISTSTANSRKRKPETEEEFQRPSKKTVTSTSAAGKQPLKTQSSALSQSESTTTRKRALEQSSASSPREVKRNRHSTETPVGRTSSASGATSTPKSSEIKAREAALQSLKVRAHAFLDEWLDIKKVYEEAKAKITTLPRRELDELSEMLQRLERQKTKLIQSYSEQDRRGEKRT
ncbi:hypothetical protein AAP_00028 [Ascosphaera apis ARSEF 7405]|uniref:Uncharacterized protein n=1 Tax=Ascosphaera apis ARSEF 7405 TaxID=392613 RepID=A0A168DI39_9EURO|nr:hypothetical protein AAP_00028 [Ascosphaera apis ARSEF 7405]